MQYHTLSLAAKGRGKGKPGKGPKWKGPKKEITKQIVKEEPGAEQQRDWKCSGCGHLVFAKAKAKFCPACGAPKA